MSSNADVSSEGFCDPSFVLKDVFQESSFQSKKQLSFTFMKLTEEKPDPEIVLSQEKKDFFRSWELLVKGSGCAVPGTSSNDGNLVLTQTSSGTQREDILFRHTTAMHLRAGTYLFEMEVESDWTGDCSVSIASGDTPNAQTRARGDISVKKGKQKVWKHLVIAEEVKQAFIRLELGGKYDSGKGLAYKLDIADNRYILPIGYSKLKNVFTRLIHTIEDCARETPSSVTTVQFDGSIASGTGMNLTILLFTGKGEVTSCSPIFEKAAGILKQAGLEYSRYEDRLTLYFEGVNCCLYTNCQPEGPAAWRRQDPNLSRELRHACGLSSDYIMIVRQDGTLLDAIIPDRNVFGIDLKKAALVKGNILDVFPALAEAFDTLYSSSLKKLNEQISFTNPVTGKSMTINVTIDRSPMVSSHIHVAVRDVTYLEIEKEFLKSHDKNTMLQNRAALFVRLNNLIFECKASRQVAALILIHIDNLRHLNLSGNIRVGDKLVLKIADYLSHTDFIHTLKPYRVRDGAQFAVICLDPGSPELIIQAASDLLCDLPHEILLNESETTEIHYSFGIMPVNEYTGLESPESVYQKAEYALTIAKANYHSDTIEVYQSKEHLSYLTKLKHINTINEAIRNNRFETWFQPIGKLGWSCDVEALRQELGLTEGQFNILMEKTLMFEQRTTDRLIVRKDIHDLDVYFNDLLIGQVLSLEQKNSMYDYLVDGTYLREIVSFEALLRLRDTSGVYHLPSEFILIAEETGQITEIEWQTLPRTLNAAAPWLAKYENLRLSINLSMKLLRQKDFARRLLDIIDTVGFNPERLNIEFVERDEVIGDFEDNMDQYQQIIKQGIRLYSDDFGEGTNSLYKMSVLNEVIDTIKISTSFVKNICTHNIMEHAVDVLSYTGQMFKKQVIAEGVETKDILNKLSTFGSIGIQGFGVAKAMPAEFVAVFLDAFSGLTGESRYCFPLPFKIDMPYPVAHERSNNKEDI